MADNISLISCPGDCATDNVWPAIPAEQDCPSYEQSLSQVSDLIIIPDAGHLPNLEQPDIFNDAVIDFLEELFEEEDEEE